MKLLMIPNMTTVIVVILEYSKVINSKKEKSFEAIRIQIFLGMIKIFLIG